MSSQRPEFEERQASFAGVETIFWDGNPSWVEETSCAAISEWWAVMLMRNPRLVGTVVEKVDLLCRATRRSKYRRWNVQDLERHASLQATNRLRRTTPLKAQKYLNCLLQFQGLIKGSSRTVRSQGHWFSLPTNQGWQVQQTKIQAPSQV